MSIVLPITGKYHVDDCIYQSLVYYAFLVESPVHPYRTSISYLTYKIKSYWTNNATHVSTSYSPTIFLSPYPSFSTIILPIMDPTDIPSPQPSILSPPDLRNLSSLFHTVPPSLNLGSFLPSVTPFDPGIHNNYDHASEPSLVHSIESSLPSASSRYSPLPK